MLRFPFPAHPALRVLAVGISSLVLAMPGCSSSTVPQSAARTYRMGFTHYSPQLTLESALATLAAWEPRGDAGLVPATPPWEALLGGTSASAHIRKEYLGLVEYYRARGFMVVVMIDATDGFQRDKEAAELVALGRSIGEPEIQALYREFAIALDTILRPDYLGLAMETNLVRTVAPAALYSNLRTLANSTAAAIQATGSSTPLFSTVQVEAAWGKLAGTNTYVGIAQDRADFPFMDMLGLSSYPNLTTVAVPEDLPLDYYSRLVPEGDLPMMVLEGGWASETVVHPSSPTLQARYIRRQVAIADSAKLIGLFQLTYSDLDVGAYGEGGSQLAPFATLGLATTSLAPKPALAEWDHAFARELTER